MSHSGSRTSSKARNKHKKRSHGGSSSISQKSRQKFPGSLALNNKIVCKASHSKKWRKATIIHCRPLPNLDRLPSLSQDYEYYVHFTGYDRRLDCWVARDNIIENETEVPEGDHIDSEPSLSSDEEHDNLDQEYLREHEENTKLKTIEKVQIGPHLLDTWYFSPYPRDVQNVDLLYICERCLNFFRTELEMNVHSKYCTVTHPPGNEIYREGDISLFELDGSFSKIFCENLCFISKLFLDHKTLRNPVSLFLFYVLCEIKPKGFIPAGYFSKEKYSKNNLSCICTWPQHQRKGYGKQLIHLSYLLSKQEGKRGTPERPLSDLGRASYLSYWTSQILDVVKHKSDATISEIADITCIETKDIIRALNYSKLLVWYKGIPFLCLLPELVEHLETKLAKSSKKPDGNFLHWEPYDAYLAPSEFCPSGS
eukprot:GHVP01016221.1.p1 GENE.GHVP01016221.1~~GHVP01016221.1.p1  ORF type:complete len:444 (+),score=52.76 GHVP01016221.1:59-1333(+)